MTGEQEKAAEQRERVLDAFLAFTAERGDLTRTFARMHGMHATDSVAIVAIIDAEKRGMPLTPVRLAERIGLTGGATSILLNRLEGAGFIQRTRGHADRRMVTLHSTAAVHEIADAFFGPLRQRFEAMMRGVSTSDLQLVARFADDLRATMTAYRRSLGEIGSFPDLEVGAGDRSPQLRDGTKSRGSA